MPPKLNKLLFVGLSSLLLSACEPPASDSTLSDPPAKTSSLSDGSESLTASADAKPVIHWAKPGFAPLFIYDGVEQNRGIGDQIFSEIQELMPEYSHVNLKLNYSRLFEELLKGSEVCAILHHIPEREEFLVYSKPIIIYPTYQLYVSQKGLQRFKEQTQWSGGPIGFNHIMAKSRGLKMLITPRQSYGVDRDEVLKRYGDNVEFVKNFAGKDAMVKMLAADRMDMTLSLPLLMNYRMERDEIRSELVKVQLADVGRYDKSHIGCADTPQGRSVIATIDSLSPAVHERSKELVPRWLTAKETQEYYDIYQPYFFEGQTLP